MLIILVTLTAAYMLYIAYAIAEDMHDLYRQRKYDRKRLSQWHVDQEGKISKQSKTLTHAPHPQTPQA